MKIKLRVFVDRFDMVRSADTNHIPYKRFAEGLKCCLFSSSYQMCPAILTVQKNDETEN